MYEVTHRDAIRDTVIPFFEKFVLWSHSKKRDFEIFKAICALVRKDKKLNVDTVRDICHLIDKKPYGSSKKYTTDDVMERCLQFSDIAAKKLISKKKLSESLTQSKTV